MVQNQAGLKLCLNDGNSPWNEGGVSADERVREDGKTENLRRQPAVRDAAGPRREKCRPADPGGITAAG